LKDSDQVFNAPRFTPFTIIAREAISSTGFILTLRPHKFVKMSPPQDPYTNQWNTGTWSVEFKQPQLQIARLYTPLPPDDHKHTRVGDLRFLIRKERGGEVSNYLAALPIGSQVELRGPHSGVDLTGHITDVVFLAGGTGISPALQVAQILLERRKEGLEAPKIHIVWANRRREDCLGGPGDTSTEKLLLQNNPDWSANKIVNELERLRLNHTDRLNIDYLVDEEGQFINHKKILSLLRNDPQKYGAVTTSIDSKLIFISGPEGFVNFLAGPKRWEGGKETQGEIGGVIGRLGLSDWKVWKL